MLIGYNPNDSLYVIGAGIPSQEIVHWIKQEFDRAKVQYLSREQYNELPVNSQCVIGFVNAEYRKSLLDDVKCQQHRWLTYIHPTSTVENILAIGKGSIVEPNCTVMYEVVAGDFLWVAPHSMIGHATTLGNNVIVNPGTMIGGSAYIGNNVVIGQGSSIRDRLTIVDNVELCMGSVVTKDIVASGKYFGNRKTNV